MTGREWLMILGGVVLLPGMAVRNAGASEVAYDIIGFGRAAGLERPYVNRGVKHAEPLRVVRMLAAELSGRGAQLLVVDEEGGLVSWCDTGMGFTGMPTEVRERHDVPHLGKLPTPALWHGIVHGAARLRPAREGTWVHLRAVGREPGSAKVVFSDGAYERTLLRALERRLERSGLEEVSESILRAGSPRGGGQAANYTRLFATQFRTLPQIRRADVQAAGQTKVYPVPLLIFWAAAFDVLSQYDAIARASRDEGVIVFAQGSALPKSDEKAPEHHVNVLLALQAAARGTEGTAVTVAYLAPSGLAVRQPPDLRGMDKEAIVREATARPVEVAAALITNQLFEQLATQLFHGERWGQKLAQRRR